MSNGAGSAGTGAQPPAAPDLPRRSVTPLPPGTTPLEPSDPKQVGEYQILAMLGIGGMGSVYLGQGPDGGRVAVKVVHPHLASDPEFLRRFAAEVHAARKVPAFCTAPVRDSGTQHGRPYLITDYLEGIALSRLIADDGPLDAASVHGLALGAAAALTAIHGAGVVHRDLKPSNMVVTLGGVRIIDFGIARSLDIAHSHTRTGVILGSLGWASPEQLNAAPATPAMDVFGWGCLVAYAATGKHPFGGEEAATRAWRILHADPDLDEVPDTLRYLVRAALSREPVKRPSARELLLTLTQANTMASAWAGDGTDGVPPPSPATPLSAAAAEGAGNARSAQARAQARRRVAVTAATVPLALAVVFAAVKATSNNTDPMQPGERTGGDTSIVSTLTPGARKPGGDNNLQPGESTPSNGAPVRPNRTPAGIGGAAIDHTMPPAEPSSAPPSSASPTTEPSTEPSESASPTPTDDPTAPAGEPTGTTVP